MKFIDISYQATNKCTPIYSKNDHTQIFNLYSVIDILNYLGKTNFMKSNCLRIEILMYSSFKIPNKKKRLQYIIIIILNITALKFMNSIEKQSNQKSNDN